MNEKKSIWDVVTMDYIAKDKDGKIYLYEDKPERSDECFDDAIICRRIDGIFTLSDYKEFDNYENIPWVDSLLTRPVELKNCPFCGGKVEFINPHVSCAHIQHINEPSDCYKIVISIEKIN